MDTVTIRAKIDQGLTLTAQDGRTLTLAVIDESGRVLQSGPAVSKAVFESAISAYDSFWKGGGHMSVIERLDSK